MISRPRLLVVSIFSPSDSNRSWYALQQSFLKKTSDDVEVDHRVYLSGVTAEEVGDGVVVAGRTADNKGHSDALSEVLRLFRASDHDSFLILDSDCFPVHRGWYTVLTNQMERFRKRFAAPIRMENLDRYPHPCAFFIAGSAVNDPRINFELGHVAPNLIGEPVQDVGNAMLNILPDLFPMMRSNLRNRHPVAAGVYHHLFYHHGAGSRDFRFRLIHRYGYCDHWWDEARDRDTGEELTGELFEDPDRFLASLMNG